VICRAFIEILQDAFAARRRDRSLSESCDWRYVHNTLTNKKELFVPTQPKVVRIYTRGLTVYAPMRIGHARTYCFWDVFRR
jgi:hypothetical protein